MTANAFETEITEAAEALNGPAREPGQKREAQNGAAHASAAVAAPSSH